MGLFSTFQRTRDYFLFLKGLGTIFYDVGRGIRDYFLGCRGIGDYFLGCRGARDYFLRF